MEGKFVRSALTRLLVKTRERYMALMENNIDNNSCKRRSFDIVNHDDIINSLSMFDHVCFLLVDIRTGRGKFCKFPDSLALRSCDGLH